MEIKVGKKLKLLREKFNFSQEDFAKVLGLSAKSYWNYENDKRVIPSKVLSKIVHCYRLNLNWLFCDVEPMIFDNDNIYKIADDMNKYQFFEIPVRKNVEASMGYGAIIYDESETDTYIVTKQFVEEINFNPDEADIIFARGDSMEPTIYGGDSILIDKSRKDIHDGCIYCIRLDGQLLIKRLQLLGRKKIGIISDNPKYKIREENLNDESVDFDVIGEVRWWGRVAK